jgi:glycosyltransferase involved in cell wall biosynthesis
MDFTVSHTTVGILIPTFNRLGFLKEALGSIITQSYANIAIIVIDNGSVDGTAEYMASLVDPRIKYVVNEQNLGLTGSINRGIGLMPADVSWCTVVCDDDYLDQDWVGLMVTRMQASNARAVVDSHRVFVDGNGNRLQDALVQAEEENAIDFLTARWRKARETYLTGILFSRHAFFAIGGYPAFTTGLASDDAFIFALSLQDRLVSVSAAIAFNRIHEGAESRTSADGLAKLKSIEEFSTYCFNAFQKHGGTAEDLKRVTLILTQHCRELFSFWWLMSIHALFAAPLLDRSQLGSLMHLVEQHPERFLPRVHAAAACQRRYGFCPEGFGWYQQACLMVKWLIRPFRKIISRSLQ